MKTEIEHAKRLSSLIDDFETGWIANPAKAAISNCQRHEIWLKRNRELLANAPVVLKQRDELAKLLGRVLNRIDKQHQDERADWDWSEDDAELFNTARAALANCEKENASDLEGD